MSQLCEPCRDDITTRFHLNVTLCQKFVLSHPNRQCRTFQNVIRWLDVTAQMLLFLNFHIA